MPKKLRAYWKEFLKLNLVIHEALRKSGKVGLAQIAVAGRQEKHV
jgi:hypothetical protein